MGRVLIWEGGGLSMIYCTPFQRRPSPKADDLRAARGMGLADPKQWYYSLDIWDRTIKKKVFFIE